MYVEQLIVKPHTHVQPRGGNMRAVLNEKEYKEFTEKVDICSTKGTEVPHVVTHNKEAKTFEVELLGNPDLSHLDSLTEV